MQCPCSEPLFEGGGEGYGLGARIRDSGSGLLMRLCRDSGFGFRDSGYGNRVSGFGIRNSGFGIRNWGLGIWDWGLGIGD